MIHVALSTTVIQRGKSGVATYVFGLLEGFRRNGWPVKISLLGLTEDRPLFDEWVGPCDWIEIDERWRPAPANIFWHQFILPRWLKRTDIDILHIPSYRRIVGGIPCAQVATIHDCAPFRFPGKYDALRMFYGRRIVVPLARRCEAILTVSETTATDIETYFGIPKAEITVTPNGIDHHRFNPDTAQARLPQLDRPAGLEPNWWIYVARLEHPAKNHLRLIDAFTELHRRHGDDAGQLVLAGADWHGAEAIHEAVQTSPARDRIFQTGFVATEDLAAWYGGARALVFPSLFEGFGLPPLEAMACGCPVLSSHAGSLGEIVADAALPLDPLEPTSITEAMERLLVEPALLADLVQRGLARARQFRWETTATQTLAVYEKLAATSKRAQRSQNG